MDAALSGGKELRSGAFMHLIGAIELPGGWYFDSLHVPGVLNDVPDGVFRGGTPLISVEA